MKSNKCWYILVFITLTGNLSTGPRNIHTCRLAKFVCSTIFLTKNWLYNEVNIMFSWKFYWFLSQPIIQRYAKYLDFISWSSLSHVSWMCVRVRAFMLIVEYFGEICFVRMIGSHRFEKKLNRFYFDRFLHCGLLALLTELSLNLFAYWMWLLL